MKSVTKLFLSLLMTGIFSACSEEIEDSPPPFIIFKQGDALVEEGDAVPVGGRLAFGISASGGGSNALTNLTVVRYTSAGKTTMMDKGIYIPVGGIDTTLYFTKGNDGTETWRFFVMNSSRDTSSVSMTILQGEGSAYGDIYYYPSIMIGYQGNTLHSHYIDLNGGSGYSDPDVTGHEAEIDLSVIWYITSGKSSPTLSAPSYSSITGYYPSIGSWPVRNQTLFDYKTSDNNLISVEEFDAAQNDSLLVEGYNPEFTSGWCKYALSGKVIPFKTAGGKHGLLKVTSAEENETGFMEIAVKVQK